jgi:NADPH:quinone reductase-like Zn-dependent oxidoreductase
LARGYEHIAVRRARSRTPTTSRSGVGPERIDTIIDFAAAQKYAVMAEGSAAGSSASVLAELAALIADGELIVPIAACCPLKRYATPTPKLARRHTRGKIVLRLRSIARRAGP